VLDVGNLSAIVLAVRGDVFGTSKVPMPKTLNALTLEKTYPPYKNLAFQG